MVVVGVAVQLVDKRAADNNLLDHSLEVAEGKGVCSYLMVEEAGNTLDKFAGSRGRHSLGVEVACAADTDYCYRHSLYSLRFYY